MPPPPRPGAVVRQAFGDFYFNSWRFVPLNLIWGATAVALWVLWIVQPAAIVLAPLLAFPTAAIFRVAAIVQRGEQASFWDGLRVWRTHGPVILALGILIAACSAMFIVNIAVGLESGSFLGWTIATLAAWGALATWLLAWTTWPILLDPARADVPVLVRLRTAALLVLAFPVRLAALGGLLAVVVLASAVAVVALLSVSVAFAALVSTRFTLPAADRLEVQLAGAAG